MVALDAAAAATLARCSAAAAICLSARFFCSICWLVTARGGDTCESGPKAVTSTIGHGVVPLGLRRVANAVKMREG